MKRKLLAAFSLFLVISNITVEVGAATLSGNSIDTTEDATVDEEWSLYENDVDSDSEDFGEQFTLSYQDVDDPVPVMGDSVAGVQMYGVESNAAITIPAYFNSMEQNQVPSSFRNQGSYGTCWSFASIGAGEASLISQGIAGQGIDLSERHLAYYFYNKDENLSDTKGHLIGDYNRNISAKTYYNIGGNLTFSMWHLASWGGLVPEAKAPYTEIKSSDWLPQTPADAYGSNTYHLKDAYIVNKADQNQIKELIMQYGAMGIAYYATNSANAERTKYDSPANNSYYCYDKTTTNHAVLVMGWDDNFPKENFVTQPAGDGAWLVRNSWGAESSYHAQNGYFWLSYYDSSLNDNFYAFVCEEASEHDNIYQYDGASGNRKTSVYSAANVYTADSDNADYEVIDAVGIGNYTNGARYTVSIYTGLTNPNDPTSGTLATKQDGTFKYTGYNTVALYNPVTVQKGEKFSVVFDFVGYTSVYADMTYQNSDWIYFTTQESTQNSFAKKSSSGAWLDATSSTVSNYSVGCTIRIKAYTSDLLEPEDRIPLRSISLDSTNAELKPGNQLKLAVNYNPINTTSDRTTTFTSSDTNVATVSSTGVVTAKATGVATITATCKDKTATCTIFVNGITIKDIAINEVSDMTIRTNVTISGTGVKNAFPKLKYRVDEPQGTPLISQTSAGVISGTDTVYAFNEWLLYSGEHLLTLYVTVNNIDYPIGQKKFTIGGHSIEYVLNGTTTYPATNSALNPAGFFTGEGDVGLYEPSRVGYTFAGWHQDPELQYLITSIPSATAKNVTLYAAWVPNYYKIKFDGNGATSGSTSSMANCSVGTNYTLNGNAFAKKGYTFNGWNTKADGSGKAYSDMAIVKDLSLKSGDSVTLYAQWKATQYTITYELNGGTQNELNPSAYTKETSTITLQKPTKRGYTFAGWYKESTFVNKVTEIAKGSTGNKTFYAKWTPLKYKVAFKGNGATSGSMDTVTYTYEKSYNLPANSFKRKGYIFTGWNTKADGSAPAIIDRNIVHNWSIIPGEVIYLYAQWERVEYTISYEANGGNYNNSNPTHYNVDTPNIALNTDADTISKTGYTFGGWYKDAAFEKESNVIVQGTAKDLTLYAKWIINKYKIKFKGNGATSGSMSTLTCKYGKDYTLTANAFKKKGYKFIGWNTEADGSGDFYTNKQVVNTLNENAGAVVYLYAQWERVEYTVTYPDLKGTNNEVNPISYNVDTPSITLKKPVRPGYTFGGWYTDSALTNKVTKLAGGATGNKKLYAKWTANQYSVKFSKNTGSGSMAAISGKYKTGKLLPACTYTKSGYEFVGWNTKADGSGTSYADRTDLSVFATTTGTPTTIKLYAQWQEVGIE